jgi:uncharacterized protein YdhG (YjbR/CyaY superfamily)
MNKSHLKFKDIDEYHASQSKDIQVVINQLRKTIVNAAPGAKQEICYGMPAFRKNKVLVYYAVNKNHIGFYPTPSPIIYFKKELASYQTSKGAIQFPINQSLPLDLVEKIVKFRVEEDALLVISKKK